MIARYSRFFLSTGPYRRSRDEIVSALGKERVFYYASSETASNPETYTTKYPTDEREIVEEFLLQLSDVALVPVATERMRHSFFSRSALVYDQRKCEFESFCQPCLNWDTVDNFSCAAQAKIRRPRVCQHSLWYRWWTILCSFFLCMDEKN